MSRRPTPTAMASSTISEKLRCWISVRPLALLVLIAVMHCSRRSGFSAMPYSMPCARHGQTEPATRMSRNSSHHSLPDHRIALGDALSSCSLYSSSPTLFVLVRWWHLPASRRTITSGLRLNRLVASRLTGWVSRHLAAVGRERLHRLVVGHGGAAPLATSSSMASLASPLSARVRAMLESETGQHLRRPTSLAWPLARCRGLRFEVGGLRAHFAPPYGGAKCAHVGMEPGQGAHRFAKLPSPSSGGGAGVSCRRMLGVSLSNVLAARDRGRTDDMRSPSRILREGEVLWVFPK